MKKILLSLFVLIYNFSYSQINLNNGLVGYYPFSGNANDVSGHGNNGVVNNATLTNDRYGNPNSAYLFDGSTSFIQIPNSNSFQFGSNISLVAVVKPTGFYSGKCHGNSIIFKGYGDPDPSLSILRFEDGQYLNYNNCSMPVDPQHQNFYGQYTYGAPGYTPYIVANQWYCVVYTYDGNVAKLYIDGQLKVSYNITGLNFNNSEDIFLGMANQPGFPYWFKGVLDEVRIYNRALNAQEVTSLCGCVNTSINTQPHDTAVCEGASVKFDISAVNASAYQWQINEGSGWVNLIDNNNYSGSNAQTLNIKTTNASMNDVKYHVIVSNCNAITSADEL